jgi:outer membrane protein OmpA-like peptidoglycan-associated protein
VLGKPGLRLRFKALLTVAGSVWLAGCPPTTRQTVTDSSGSAPDDAEIEVVVFDRSRSISFEPVRFAVGSVELSDEARGGLDAPNARLARSSTGQLELVHHCAARDRDLCVRRAEAIAAYFVGQGLDPGRIRITDE